MASTAPRTAWLPRSRGAAYRPHLDGIRTVAVYLVVAFHARLGAFSGGFIGVDVFYVLSGYLVTGILLRDLASGGRVRWISFYSRRMRRLLPAAFVALLVTAFVYAAVATRVEMSNALGGFRAAFLYVANWHFISQSTDYFAADVNANPVLHYWSLAVEEQFYLAWPLLLGGLYFVATKVERRRRWWFVRGAVAAGGLLSLAVALRLNTTNPVHAYYGTDARAYQLLAGALLALTPQLLHLRGRALDALARTVPVALAVLFVVGTSVIDVSPVTRGAIVALVASILIVALENPRRGVVKDVLSSGAVTYLGRISYGTYLWHWPVVVIANYNRDLSPIVLFILSAGLATALAAVSFHLIERPVRISRSLDRYKAPVVAIGFTTSIVIGLVVMPAILDRGGDSIVVANVSGISGSGPIRLDWRAARQDIPPIPDCLNAPVQQCTVVRGIGPHVLLMGDSDARMWAPAFTQMAKNDGSTFSAAIYPGCPWQDGLQYAGGRPVIRACEEHQQDWYRRVIPQLKPDVIVTAQLAYDDPAMPKRMIPDGGAAIVPGKPNFEPTLRDISTRSIGQLRSPGRKIVVLEPVPIPPGTFDPLSCLSDGGSLEKCSYQANKQPTELELYLRTIARADVFTTIDVDRLVCPRLPTCDPVVHRMIVRRDQVHLTATFSRSLAAEIDAAFRAEGVLSKP